MISNTMHNTPPGLSIVNSAVAGGEKGPVVWAWIPRRSLSAEVSATTNLYFRMTGRLAITINSDAVYYGQHLRAPFTEARFLMLLCLKTL